MWYWRMRTGNGQMRKGRVMGRREEGGDGVDVRHCGRGRSRV